ncbi:RNA-binding protein [Candidatus Woesearchaeota archaeon]|nr:RNA-binding protein [Candidatus Woesearchaeota archaeon]
MRKQLNKSEIKKINKTLNELYDLDEFFSKKDKLELEENEYKIIKKDDKTYFFYHEKLIVPTLKNVLENNFLKKTTVDMGAIKFVTSGADVMRPGIVKIDKGIKQNDVIAIVDEKHDKPLAIGIALFSSEEIKKQKSGKSIKILHYVGDKLWKEIN